MALEAALAHLAERHQREHLARRCRRQPSSGMSASSSTSTTSPVSSSIVAASRAIRANGMPRAASSIRAAGPASVIGASRCGAGGRHETKRPPGGGLWSGNANTPPKRRATRCGSRHAVTISDQRMPDSHASASARSSRTSRPRAAAGRRLEDVPAVNLGMPKVPEVLAPRRKTRQIKVGKVLVGGNAPVSVQSMCTTPTTNINATLQQIAELTASGCEIVRVAVPSQDDADVLHIIAKKSQIPVIADIHFQPKYVFQAIDAGCAAVRVNPGNIRKFDDQVGEIAKAAKDAGVSLRIGVNAGSLDPRLLQKYGKATPEALVESARLGGVAVRGARLPRLQDLGQAQRPGHHGEGLPPARRAGRLAAAPRRDRGRPGVPGHDQERDRVRHPARARASATRSASRCRRRRPRRSRSATRSCSR